MHYQVDFVCFLFVSDSSVQFRRPPIWRNDAIRNVGHLNCFLYGLI